MMNSLEILEVYEKVSLITSGMLQAARQEDWDLLQKLESDCSAHVSTLRLHDTSTDLPSELKQRKISIIKQILADDRAIRDLTEPWMQQLSKLMNSSRNSRQLSESYGANQLG